MPWITRITGTNGNDILTAVMPGRHRIEGLDGDDKLTGGASDDSLYGGNGRDILIGGGGNDSLNGGAGPDQLIGGTGEDTASYLGSSSGVNVSLLTGRGAGGDAAGDTLVGVENLRGSDFADVLVGNATDNRLHGGQGDDLLVGGGGNDSFKGDAGADRFDGGIGTDTADYAGSFSAVTVNLQAGVGTAGDALGDRFTSIENVIGTFYNDKIVGNAAANVLNGSFGDDMLAGGDGADTLEGSFGNDILEGGAGADVISGSFDVDLVTYAKSNGAVSVNLATGTAAGGHAQGDVLSAIENITGSAFADLLTGSRNDNIIRGGNGADKIRAGAGSDQIWGGTGNDAFLFNQADQPLTVGGANLEWIGDFVAGGVEDVIDLAHAGTGYAALADVLANAIEAPLNAPIGTYIDLGPSGQVYLAGVRMADLTSGDFIFV